MSGGNRFFVDTNVLLYCLDSTDERKQHSATEWVDCLWQQSAGSISWQVLHEFYVNAMKLSAKPQVARSAVEAYLEWQRVEVTPEVLRVAWQWIDRAGTSYWDALILSCAERSGCQWLLSEDFQSGRQYGPVRVVNPFQNVPGEFF